MKRFLCLALAIALCFPLAACDGNSVKGKRLSILGDSVSTFDGISNDATILPELAGNPPFFPQFDILTLEDTWWKQAADALEMTCLVNNSYSGGWVSLDMAGMGGTSALGRCTSLAAGNALPDIIAFYMGVNDCRFGMPAGSADAVDTAALPLSGGDAPADFATAYATALVRIQAAYPDARLYCCTLPAATADACTPQTLGAYNDVIRALAVKLD
ncbi:MAG: GDSL-type esterase/lipase family protein, partial [Ruthenibacterium sp.]